MIDVSCKNLFSHLTINILVQSIYRQQMAVRYNILQYITLHSAVATYANCFEIKMFYNKSEHLPNFYSFLRWSKTTYNYKVIWGLGEVLEWVIIYLLLQVISGSVCECTDLLPTSRCKWFCVVVLYFKSDYLRLNVISLILRKPGGNIYILLFQLSGIRCFSFRI